MNKILPNFLLFVFLSHLIAFTNLSKGQTVLFEDSFESGELDPAFWTSRPSLEGASGGFIEVTDIDTRTGTYAVRLGRTSDGAQTTNALDLRLDLSGQTNVELRFWLRDYFNDEVDQDGLYFSDDGGGTFVQVYTIETEQEPNDVFMNPPPIDVDALALANGLELTSTFVIRFQQVGDADFSTSGDEDGFFIDDVSVTAPEVVYATLPFTDSFEEGVLGPMWQETNASEPAVGQVTAPSVAPSRMSGLLGVFDSNARTGTYSVWMGRNRDGAQTTNALDLRLDLSGQTNVELRFWLRDYFNDEVDQDGLYFSDDGGATFVQVYTIETEQEPNDVFMNPPPIDVDALALANGLELTSTFVIRFQQVGDADFSTSGDEDGFFIDDVSVTAPEVVYATLPFTDSFEEGVLGPMWQETNASEPAVGQVTAPSVAPSRMSGLLGVFDSNARTGTYSVWMGRNRDGAQTTNALDLRLDLSGQTNVELRFWLRDYFNDEVDQDGLYFSDDGGATFVQVYTIETEQEPNDVFMNPPPIDVDALALANGLELTSTFVIRFQQVGDADFSTSGDEDGFFIDDVSVTAPEVVYATLPFTDSFEEGVLGPMWQETNASEPAVGQVTAPSVAPSRMSGLLGVFDSNARTGTYAVWMGRNRDGAQTTNALDLRLDLSGQTNVELRFWLRDFANEEVDQDGLYFSDDGGATFVQVINLDTDTRENGNYIEDVIDVDAMASDKSLGLTSTFVIRFQQIGDADFNTSGDEDGFFIDDISITGDISTSIEEEVGEQTAEKPFSFHLGQNYPNPFNPKTSIPFEIEKAGLVTLGIYDLLGREVKVLVNEVIEAGKHTVTFDAGELPSGTYFYRIQAGSFSSIKQMTLLK